MRAPLRGRPRRLVPDSDAQGPIPTLPVGGSAHSGRRSLPEGRAARSPPRFVALPLGEVCTPKPRLGGCRSNGRRCHYGAGGFFHLAPTHARNEAVAEAARTQRIQRFTLNLFQGGDESVGPADDLRVVTLLDRGVQEARALDSEPAMQAELYQTLGGIYQNLGKLEQADNLLRTSLEQRKKIFGPEHWAVAESLVALGLLRDAQAQYEEAEMLVRDGLARSERNLPANHPAIAKATSTLGKVLEDRGEYDKAIQVLERAVALQSAPGASTADLGASLSELANCHFYAGHYDISESLTQRALRIDRQLYGERHPNVANDLINLGAIQQEKGSGQGGDAITGRL